MNTSSIAPQKTLYLIPVPLTSEGNLQTLSPEVLAIVPSLKLFFVENIRSARRFIASLKMGIVIDDLTFLELNINTTEEDLGKLFKVWNESKLSAGILSEAGCPAVADPGSLLVSKVQQNGGLVKPLVGPNSMLLALMASGLGGQQFQFSGYLPIEEAARKKAVSQMENAAQKGVTQIFMETPYRNNQVLAFLLQNLPEKIKLCIAANITGENEYIKTLSVKEWKKAKQPNLHKVPAVFVLGY